MNFLEMQNEVIHWRTKAAQREYVKRQLNHRYSWVWSQSDWPFKYAAPTNVTVTSTDPTPTLPTDLKRVLSVFNERGNQLVYRVPRDFWAMFPATASGGTPTEFTVVNGSLYLGPTPSTDATFQVAYERKLSHLDAGTTTTPGLMDGDTDEPLWDDEHHYLLVLGALSTLLKTENDPTWEPLEQEFANAFSNMMNDLLPPDRTETLQYGRDMLGYEAWG